MAGTTAARTSATQTSGTRASAAGTAGGSAYSRWARRARCYPRAVDAAVVLLLCVCSFSGAVLSAPGAPAPSQPTGAGAIVISCVVLFGHRRLPRLTAAVAIGCTIALAAQGFVLTPLLLAPTMVALFLLSGRASRRSVYGLTLAAIAGVTLTAVVAGPVGESIGLKVLGPQAWLLLPALAGLAARSKAQYAARARDDEARARDEEARHRVAEERMRIARELHDAVAHHLALANAQAGTVAHLIAADPGRAERMATDLAGTVGSALRELKGTVGLLRAEATPEVPLESAPSLTRLPALAESFAVAGLRVDVTEAGTARPLSPAVDLTAFRIIQEALTNVAKHAGARQADVSLAYSGSLLTVAVVNEAGRDRPVPGTPLETAVSGYGLIGMHERAASVGGRLRTGPRSAGGFEVIAELPLEPGPHEAEAGLEEAEAR
jgi:signal transduction histidine kinase